MRGSKLQMGVIKKQDFVVTSNTVKDLFEGWDTWWKRDGISRIREISCLMSVAMIGFYGILRGEKVIISFFRIMLEFWEEKCLRKE